MSPGFTPYSGPRLLGHVLRRNADGFFVCPGGMEKSYSPSLADAEVFRSLAKAELGRCVESETLCKLEEVGGRLVVTPV